MLAAQMLARLAEPTEHCAHLNGIDGGHLLIADPGTPWRRLWALLMGKPTQTLLCATCLTTMRELWDERRQVSKREVFARLAALDYTSREQRMFWRDLRRAA